MSNFGYKDAKGQIVKVPVRYGDMNRQVGSILKKNSENTIASAPFIACYIKDLQFDRSRLQDPTFISKVQIRERAFDATNNEYQSTQGSNFTVERIMPTPYLATFAADIWTTNLDQKLQLWEQITVIFNPSLEIQTTDNYIDWTSLSVLERHSEVWSSRSIPQGVEQDIDIMNMTFTAPIWITPPAKVKKLGIITKIIANVFAVGQGGIDEDYANSNIGDIIGVPDTKIIITPGNFDLLVLGGVAQLIKSSTDIDNVDITLPQNINPWFKILDLYPGKFTAGLSQLRLMKPDGNEIVAYISLDPLNDSRMILNIDRDTVPSNTIIKSRGTVDYIINPETYIPDMVSDGTRYLILENLNINAYYGVVQTTYDGPDAWKNSDGTDPQAFANDIIEWDGSKWVVIFNSRMVSEVTYITNAYTGVQYKWDSISWSKSFEGVYEKLAWRLIL